MKRISLYVLIPCLLMILFFKTEYFDAYILTIAIFSIINFIRRKHTTKFILILFFTVFSFFNCTSTYSLCNKSFYPIIDKPATVVCAVDETPVYDEDRILFTANLISAVSMGETIELNGKIRVFVNGTDADIDYGDKIEFKTSVTLPDENENDGSFNYREYLRSQNIHIVCEASDFAISNHGTYENINPLIHKIFVLRDAMLQKCDRYLNGDISSFLKAILLGYKADMPEDIATSVKRAGISHIVSVSGMHLSVMLIIINFLLQKLKFKGCVFIIPVFNIISAVFITAITGFSPSVKRAAIMLIISNSAALVYRENDSVQSLAFAMLILLMANPFSLFDVRLVLSAVSTLGIILLYDKVDKILSRFIKPSFIRTTLSMSVSAQIAASALCVYYFSTISTLGIVTNLIVVPMMPYLMGNSIAFMIFPFDVIAKFLSNGIWLMIKFILIISEYISAFPFAILETSIIQFMSSVLLTIFAVYMIKKTIKCRCFYKNAIRFSIACIAVILIFFPPKSNNVKLTVINVGQGDCTLMEFPDGKTMLIDGGGMAKSDYDTAEKIIKPFLIRNGTNKIDYAVITHFHEDHANGIINLADDFNIGCIITPNYFKAGTENVLKSVFDVCCDSNIPLYMIDKDDDFNIGDIASFEVLSPDNKYIYDENNASLVFKITVYGKSILFTGDIESYTQQILLQNDNISCDILKTPHHGSYSPSFEKFLNSASPEYAYICVGENNNYGHPDDKILHLYADKNVTVLRTDLDKTLKFTINKNGKIKIH